MTRTRLIFFPAAHRAFDNAAAGRTDTTPAFISRFFQLTLRILGAPPTPPHVVPLAPASYPGPAVDLSPHHEYYRDYPNNLDGHEVVSRCPPPPRPRMRRELCSSSFPGIYRLGIRRRTRIFRHLSSTR